MAEFLVARNPDAKSSLPYIVRLPIDGGLWLKVRETWPRTSRVYCHEIEEALDATALEVVERVEVMHCERRGPAIDLILARSRNKRAQFVFTAFRGRPIVWWQSRTAAPSQRPGLRIPVARAQAAARDLSILIDTRERYPYRFGMHAGELSTPRRRALAVGDYAVEDAGSIVASVERKRFDDFASSLTDGSLNYVMAELASLRAAAVVVEGRYSALVQHAHSARGYLLDMVARVQVRYPGVPIVFLESKSLAEEWTYRFLLAAHALHAGLELPLALPVIAVPADDAKAKPARRPRSIRRRKVATDDDAGDNAMAAKAADLER